MENNEPLNKNEFDFDGVAVMVTSGLGTNEERDVNGYENIDENFNYVKISSSKVWSPHFYVTTMFLECCWNAAINQRRV